MHKVAPRIEQASELPLLHIADATADVLQGDGVTRVGLLGTGFTMEQAFYRERLEARGIEVLVPDKAQRELVHRVIYEELCLGDIRPASKQAYLEVVSSLADRGAQGVILGCTEIGMLIGTDDTTRDTRSLVAQAYALREEGLSAWCHTGGYHVPPVTLTGSVRDDIVFVDPVIGVGELAISDHRSSQPTLDELLRIAGDVHVAGLITGKAGILHLHLGDGQRGLAAVRKALGQAEIPARVFNPTHVNRRAALFDEALELARAGSVIDITAFPVEDGDGAVEASLAVQHYIESGAPEYNVTVSSDGGGCLPTFDANGELTAMDIGSPSALPATLKLLLDAGVSPERALAPFTSNVARVLRLRHKGRIGPGMDADLVILDGQHHVQHVMARGEWHVVDGAQRIYGRFEGPGK